MSKTTQSPPPGTATAPKKSPSGPADTTGPAEGGQDARPQPKARAQQARDDKLAAALRANLRRRKQANR